MGKLKLSIKNIYIEGAGEHFLKKSEQMSIVYIGRVFGIPLARAVSKLPFKIHPNIITIFSFFFALLAGFCFFHNLLVFGAVFYLINFILDCTDGPLARMTSTTSEFGGKLDFYTDRIGNLSMYFGLWWSQYYQNSNWLLGVGIIFAHYAIQSFGEKFIKNLTYKTIFPKVDSYYSSFEEGVGTFFIAPILGIFPILFPILVFLQFVSYFILFVREKINN